jgi:hypothetical protein
MVRREGRGGTDARACAIDVDAQGFVANCCYVIARS